MKKAIYNICLVLAIAALASCTKGNIVNTEEESHTREIPSDWITLTFKAEAAKTNLDSDGIITWAEGDEIKIIWANGDDGYNTGVVDEQGVLTVQVAPADLYYAVYPADATASIDADGCLDVTLTQKTDGSWAKANIMAAVTTKDELKLGFKNVCNYLKFEVTDPNVTGIAFCANDNTSYKSTVKMTPKGVISEGAETRTEVQANLQGAGTYYVPVPSSLNWTKGFGVLYKSASGNKGTLTTKALKFSTGKNCINLGVLDNQFHEGDWFIKEGGSGDGSSWENAGDERLLKNLLGNSQASGNKTNGWRLNGKTIRVAKGTYDMKDNVNNGLLTLKYESMTTFSVVGGYAGNETDLSQNDPVNNVTVFTSLNPSTVTNNRMFTANNAKMSCTFDGIKFTGTQYSGRGGIIYFNDTDGYGKCEFKSCTFGGVKNTSYGGAIDLNNTKVADFLSFDNCTFDDNSATYGGAVIVEASKGETGPVFKNCTFTGNHSTATSGTAGGGAIYVLGANAAVTIDGGSFNGNTTKIVGGGAIFAVGKGSEVRINNAHFENNVSNATGGGAIALSGGGTSNLGAIGYINGCTFKKNECKKETGALDGNGGAILQVGSNSSLLFMNACSFDDNAAKTNGSDLFASAGSATCVYNCTSATPRNGSVAANLGTINCNCPLFIANSTMIVYGKGGTTTGVVRFGVNDSNNNKNFLINNLLLCNDGCSIGTGSVNTSVKVRSKGHNVYYANMEKITFEDDGGSTDKTGVKASGIWASAPGYNADGVIEWDGPSTLEGFTPATKQNVIDAMTSYAPAKKTGYSDKFGTANVGTVFYNWLVSIDAFDKDGAGNSRGDGNWWPGSYQK